MEDFKIVTNTKHITDSDVFFCFKEAEKYLTLDDLDKPCKIFAESGFLERLKSLLLLKNELAEKIVECDNLQEELVKQLKGRYSVPANLIAITGTKGKTSSCWFTMQLFGLLGYKIGYIGTLGVYFFDGNSIKKINNSDTLTTPSIEDLYYFLDKLFQNGVKYVVFEASSHALQQGRLDGLNINCSVFTNLSQDHLDYHKTMDDYFEAKTLLFTKYQQNGRTCILNADDERFEKLKNLCENNELKIISVGQRKDANFKISSITHDNFGQQVVFEFENKQYGFYTNILGEFQIYNMVEAIAVCIQMLNIDLDSVCDKVSKIQAPIGRMQQIKNTNIFVDFAHTPKSLEEGLKLLSCRYNKIITVFGCGGNRDKQKRPIMCEIACKLSHFVIITSDNPRFENPDEIIKDIICFKKNDLSNPLTDDSYVKEEIAKIDKKYCVKECEFTIITDRREAIKYAVNNYLNNKDTAVIIAGKGHENYQIINDVKHHFSDFEEVEKYIK